MTKKTEEVPPAPETETDPFAQLVPGRIVHYYPTDAMARGSCAGPWAAIVIQVGPFPGVVMLCTFPPKPTPIGTDPSQRIVEVGYSPEPAAGCWSWIFPGQATRYVIGVDPSA